jgi:hypothetical protein
MVNKAHLIGLGIPNTQMQFMEWGMLDHAILPGAR